MTMKTPNRSYPSGRRKSRYMYYNLDITNKVLFPKIHQFFYNRTFFCIHTCKKLNLMHRFEYKGVYYKIAEIIREEVKEDGYLFYEVRTLEVGHVGL